MTRDKKAGCATVLIVEDHDLIRETLRDALRVAGFEALTACDGLEATEVLAARPDVGLILLDLNMPVMNGFEFLRWKAAAAAVSAVPVVVFTAESEYSNLHGKAGVVRIVDKTRALTSLISLVSEHGIWRS